MRERRTHRSLSLLLPLLLFGCGPNNAVPVQDPPLNVHLDSGNARYAAGDAAGAREHYRTAIAADRSNAAAWFGVHMASAALGDSAVAAQALHELELLMPNSGWLEHIHPPREPDHPHATTEGSS
jgi:Tfp pilus assembly protein PilF